MRWKLRIGDVVHGTPRDPSAAHDQRRRVNLNNALLRNLCLTNRMRPSWHGSGKFLGGAPVLSRFGTRETTTAAPMNQKLHAGVAARRPAGGGPCSRAHTFSGAIPPDRRVEKKEVWNVN